MMDEEIQLLQELNELIVRQKIIVDQLLMLKSSGEVIESELIAPTPVKDVNGGVDAVVDGNDVPVFSEIGHPVSVGYKRAYRRRPAAGSARLARQSYLKNYRASLAGNLTTQVYSHLKMD